MFHWFEILIQTIVGLFNVIAEGNAFFTIYITRNSKKFRMKTIYQCALFEAIIQCEYKINYSEMQKGIKKKAPQKLLRS